MFTVTNLKGYDVTFGQYSLVAGDSISLDEIDAHVVAAKNAGLVSVSFTADTSVVTTTFSTPAVLTDNSAGTASATIAAIEATYTQATVRNAIASLAAKVNALVAEQAKNKSAIENILQLL